MPDPAEKEGKKPQASWRFLIFAILNLIVFCSSWPLVSAEFPQFSAGLQFCLAAALSMILFGIFGRILMVSGRVERDIPEEHGTRNRLAALAKGFLFISFLASMISWFPGAYIETNALSQPDHAVGQYTVPAHLKGVVRYMTPAQAITDEVAHWIFLGGIVSVLGLVALDRVQKRKRRD
jgi:hypothetical protein